MVSIAELESRSREDLISVARELGIQGYEQMRKPDLVLRLLQAQAAKDGSLLAGGIIDMVDDGYGFLRGLTMRPSISDVYVSQSQVRRFGLRSGDFVTGQVRPPRVMGLSTSRAAS